MVLKKIAAPPHRGYRNVLRALPASVTPVTSLTAPKL
jgi:hypothetical protein